MSNVEEALIHNVVLSMIIGNEEEYIKAKNIHTDYINNKIELNYLMRLKENINKSIEEREKELRSVN